MTKQDNTGVILGVDPGTRTCGYCVMTVDLDSLERVSIEAFTVNSTKPLDGVDLMDYLPEHVQETMGLILEHQRQMGKILSTYKPFQVALELPFFNRFRPNAFAPLVNLFTALSNEVYEYNPWMTVHEVENTVTKAMVAPDSKQERKRIRDEFKTSKERIAECIRIHNDFSFIDTSKYDEHQIDAILVAEWRRRQLFVGLL